MSSKYFEYSTPSDHLTLMIHVLFFKIPQNFKNHSCTFSECKIMTYKATIILAFTQQKSIATDLLDFENFTLIS